QPPHFHHLASAVKYHHLSLAHLSALRLRVPEVPSRNHMSRAATEITGGCRIMLSLPLRHQKPSLASEALSQCYHPASRCARKLAPYKKRNSRTPRYSSRNSRSLRKPPLPH
ncbi:hypothetical protein JMJ77_0006315, partial [Colletotrichum scovillei]